MNVTPEQGPTKPSRSKNVAPKNVAKEITVKADATKPVRKTLTTTRKKFAPPVAIVATTPDISFPDLNDMISTAAFYLAAERNFAPGHELDDWLEAERRVRTLYPS
jgi:hypothetical protein